MTTEEIVRELRDAVTRAQERAQTHAGGMAFGYGHLEGSVTSLIAKLELEVAK